MNCTGYSWIKTEIERINLPFKKTRESLSTKSASRLFNNGSKMYGMMATDACTIPKAMHVSGEKSPFDSVLSLLFDGFFTTTLVLSASTYIIP